MVDVPVTNVEIEKRDLSLNNPLSSEKYYNEVRNSIILWEKEKFKIDDITSIELMIIDSLDKVKRI